MLRILRSGGKHTKTIWWVLVIVTVVTFLGGFVFLFGAGFDSTTRARLAGAIGTVNGTGISRREYEYALNEQRAAFRRQYGVDPADREELMMQMQAWRSLVVEHLLTTQAKKAGLGVYDREVVLALRASPPSTLANDASFQTDGKFDPAKYQAALQNPNVDWRPFEALVRSQLPMRKLQERLLASIKLSEPELREAYRDRYERVSATVLAVPPVAEGTVPAAGEAELKRLYEEYRSRFSAGRRTQLEVLLVPKAFGEEELRAGRELAQSLADRARRGEDFAALARDYSEGPGADRGGVIDRALSPTELGAELGQHLDALPVGGISDPYRDGGRFLVFKVIGRAPGPANSPAGLRLAQIVVKIRPNENSLRQQYEDLVRLARHAAGRGVGLGRAAAEKKLATARTPFFNSVDQVPILFGVPTAADWGLTAREGEVSPVFEGLDELAVVQVIAQRPAGVPSREEIAGQLRQLAELNARVELAKPKAEAVARALAQGRSLEQAAQSASLTPFAIQGMNRVQPDPRLAAAPEVQGALFATAPGRVVGPIRSVSGWYFARVDARTTLNPAAYDTLKGNISTEILKRRQEDFFSGLLTDMRARAKIKDLRQSGGY